MTKIMVDSGAFSLYTQITRKGGGRNFFDSKEFWTYIDSYAEFVKKHIDLIDVYVNVDVIYNPKLTWEVQKYLEREHRLHPLPVFHYGEDFKWLKKYMDDHDYIGIGGLASKNVVPQHYYGFLDRVFRLLCDNKGRPRWKVHGFGITSNIPLMRYPWYSVDSTSWISTCAYGGIVVPRLRDDGSFDYEKPYYKVTVTEKAASRKSRFKEHYLCYSQKDRELIKRYVEDRGYVISYDEKDIENDRNVVSSHRARSELNLIYFLEFEKYLFSLEQPRFGRSLCLFQGSSDLHIKKQPLQWRGIRIYISGGYSILTTLKKKEISGLPITHILESYWTLRSEKTARRFFEFWKGGYIDEGKAVQG